MHLGKQTVTSRPYELDLTSKYNKYSLERARMGRYANKMVRPSHSLSLKS